MLVPLVSPKLAPREAGAVGGAPPLCAGAAALPVLVRLPRLVSRGALFVSDVVSVADVGDIEDALPWAYKDHDWELVYSLHTHGSTLETFLTNASREAPTLLLLRSAHDEVCGVFASEAWQYSARFRGSGETFIFKCRDRATAKSRADSEFRPYRWCVVVPATSVLRRGRAWSPTLAAPVFRVASPPLTRQSLPPPLVPRLPSHRCSPPPHPPSGTR
jgi:hypothetical protein